MHLIYLLARGRYRNELTPIRSGGGGGHVAPHRSTRQFDAGVRTCTARRAAPDTADTDTPTKYTRKLL